MIGNPAPDRFRSIELFEEGNQFFTDEYNKKLEKGGPRHLQILPYACNGNEFIKNNSEPTSGADGVKIAVLREGRAI